MGYTKKAEMGVGTLIIFIAMLLVAAVAAGVLIQTAGSLQEQSLSTGQQARSQISTNARVIEVSASDGRDGNLNQFSTVYKLSPGSDPIKLDQILLSESTDETSVSLKYRVGSFSVNDVFTGFFTATTQDFTLNTQVFDDPVTSEFYNVFPYYYQTSQMMVGKVAVSVIFPESNGAIDVNSENWSNTRQDGLIQATVDAFNWWNQVEPRAGLRHTLEIHRNIPTGYEPSDHPLADDESWINETLDNLGVTPAASTQLRIFAYNNQVRERMNANWAFTLFFVDSNNNGTVWGTTAGIAYVNGPYSIISSSGAYSYPDPALVVTHEMGHIFGARDEYQSSGCACTDLGGYYPIETQNCDTAGCLTNTSSIMRTGSEGIYAFNNHIASAFTLAQVGMIDIAGEDNVPDPVELLFGGLSQGMNQTDINDLALNPNNYVNSAFTNPGGFFTIEYLQEGTNHVVGNLQRGDIIKVSHEAAKSIEEDEQVRINFIPKIGTPTLTKFVTPDVISCERVYLYP